MEPETAALIGAGLGAGGAVLAQIISATVTQRFASRRFQWEQLESERARTDDRRRLFLDEKREMYAKFLRATSPSGMCRCERTHATSYSTGSKGSMWMGRLRGRPSS